MARRKAKQRKAKAARRTPEILWAERPRTTPAKPRPTAGKLGRPLLPKDRVMDAQVKVRLPMADMRPLEAYAKEKGRGLATAARLLIQAGLLAAARLKLKRASRNG